MAIVVLQFIALAPAQHCHRRKQLGLKAAAVKTIVIEIKATCYRVVGIAIAMNIPTTTTAWKTAAKLAVASAASAASAVAAAPPPPPEPQ